jgi:hypothetical protein
MSRNALTSALAKAEGQQPWYTTRKIHERTTPDFIVSREFLHAAECLALVLSIVPAVEKEKTGDPSWRITMG